MLIERTFLDHYVYDWGDSLAVVLGHGSLYNHSFTPNLIYVKCLAEHMLEYRAFTDIAAGDELVVNYNGNPGDQTPLWFDVK